MMPSRNHQNIQRVMIRECLLTILQRFLEPGIAAHACDPTYLGGRDLETRFLFQAISKGDHIAAEKAGYCGMLWSDQPCRQYK
jgi:hypothetical protein